MLIQTRKTTLSIFFCGALSIASTAFATVEPGEETITWIKLSQNVAAPKDMPDRPAGEGVGPFPRLLIKDVVIIDGTGAPAYGPASVLIENDRISEIALMAKAEDYAAFIAANDTPQTEVIEGKGHFLLPGFVDAHAHFVSTHSAYGDGSFDDNLVYASKLWLAHGVTTIRDVGASLGLEWLLRHKQRSDAGSITAPRIIAYARALGVFAIMEQQYPGKIPMADSETKIRRWVTSVKKKGAEGVKISLTPDNFTRDSFKFWVEEIKRQDLQLAVHFDARPLSITALDSAVWGADSSEHIGHSMGNALQQARLPAALPLDYITESPSPYRFGSPWDTAYPPRSTPWQNLITQLVESNHTLVPTLAIMDAFRDLMRAATAEWHEHYTKPDLYEASQPNANVYASNAYVDWTTNDEIIHKRKYQTSFQFLSDFHQAGGRIAAGSDAGYLFQNVGFGYIRELELLQEAGLHPLQVIKAATLNGAELIQQQADLGSIAVGKKADLVLLAENPLRNLKVLYGTGHQRYNPKTQQLERVGGVKYTIKDGIVWDAKQLLADVRAIVAADKARAD